MSRKQKIKQCISKFNLIIVLILIALPLLSACSTIGDSQINDTLITSTGLNLSVNVTAPLYFAVQVCDNSLYIENLRSSESTNCQISFNLTEVNASYTGNDLPSFNSCGTDSTTIFNNLTNPINASVQLDTGSPNQVGKITTSNGQTYTFSGATSNPFQLDNLNLNGDTILTVDNNKESIKTCEGFFDAGMSFGSFMIILIIVIVLVFVMLILTNDENSEFDLTTWALILLVAGAVMSIGMYIITNIGGC